MAAARAAFERGDVALVLPWVRAEDEPAVRAAFLQASAVRSLGAEARDLAERSFFETLVRVHRAGEGARFTGLTDADPEPLVASIDRALDEGAASRLERDLLAAVREGLAARFAAAAAARRSAPGDVAAGRAYVAAYVSLVHWTEGVHSAASSAPGAPGGEHRHGAAAHGGSHVEHLAWILAALLAVTTAALGACLARRRPSAA